MSGQAPKDARARHRRNTPMAGEWVDLVPLERPVLPPLPRRSTAHGGAWSAQTRATWEAWRADPATGQYTPADIAYAVDTAYLLELCVRNPRSTLAAELRIRMDGLGLSPRGRRYLRWRIAEPAGVFEHPALSARARNRRHRLRAVDDEAVDCRAEHLRAHEEDTR